MPDVGRILGALISGVAHARRIADEESAAIAEYYKSNPLLEGMSVPRIRIPELVIDLPMIIEAQEDGQASVPQDDSVIRDAVVKELKLTADREKVRLTQALVDGFQRELKVELDNAKGAGGTGSGFYREATVRAVDKAFARTVGDGSQSKLSQAQMRALSSTLRVKAGASALKQEGLPPSITASVITSDVKDKAGAGNVVRLTVTMKEEGLEWSIGKNADGTTDRKLTPE